MFEKLRKYKNIVHFFPKFLLFLTNQDYINSGRTKKKVDFKFRMRVDCLTYQQYCPKIISERLCINIYNYIIHSTYKQ